MRPYKKIISVVIVLFINISCAKELQETEFPDGGLLKYASPLPATASQYFPGNFTARYSQDEILGSYVSVIWNGNRLSVLNNNTATYAVLAAGCLNNDVLFEGAYRDPVNQNKGLIRLYIKATQGGSAICTGAAPGQISYEGHSGPNHNELNTAIALTFSGQLKSTSGFLNIAHRGGCRTIDLCGVSENSLPVISLAGSLGANGIEIDVNRTSDGVPVLYHDEDYNTRLVKGIFCLGSVSEMPYINSRIFCRLKQGEKIPTLREALELVLTLPAIRFVWLDPKTPDILGAAVSLAKEYNDKAILAGKTLEIVVGLPDADYLNRFLNTAGYANVPCLAEESVTMADAAGCKYYGPRWTAGYQTNAGTYLHTSSRKILFWTLDEVPFIHEFLNNAAPDGLLTNRPGMLFSILQYR